MTMLVFALTVKYTSLVAFPQIKYSKHNRRCTNPNIYGHATLTTLFKADLGQTGGSSSKNLCHPLPILPL